MSTEQKHLYLIDGHALAYRAYFAMVRSRLTNAQGQPTGAVFVMATWLLKLLEDYHCPYLAIVFDSPTPTFRHEMYAEYKANREEMPEDMAAQLPLVFKLVELLNIPAVRKDGFEADDLIASLTREALAEGFEVSLVTKDKDLMQLVGANVRMLAPEGKGKIDVFDAAKVREKMGVEPRRIRDLLALMGDSSDNVPGVPGVGPKTAVKILEAAGDLETLLADPSCVGNPKLEAKLREHLDDIRLSRDLVTLNNDPHEEWKLRELRAREPRREECVEFFREMEFSSLLDMPLFDTRKAVQCDVSVLRSPAEVDEFVRKVEKAGFVCVDTETTSTEPREANLVGVAMAIDPNEAVYLPVGHDGEADLSLEETLEKLRGILESEEIRTTGQNLKYDYQVFRNYGITLRGIEFDCMVAAYLIDPGKRRYGLDFMAAQWLGVKTTPIETLIGKGRGQMSFAEVPVADAAPYAGEDVTVPLRLRKVLEPVLEERNLRKLFEDVEIPLVSVLAEMEWAGILLDAGLLKKLSEEYSTGLASLSREIFALAGGEFNLNSPRQVAEVLFEKLGLPKSRKTKTGVSTDMESLAKLAPDYPIARRLLEYRELQKLVSTYLDALPGQVSAVSGRIHSSFNQTITSTGRLSSNNPNLQNIPVRSEVGRRIRKAFVAEPGTVLVSADYSQIELRILAHVSDDPLLKQAFHEDDDIHRRTASVVYGVVPEMVSDEMRRAAKTVNFGLMYGMGPANLSRQLKITFKQAREFIESYFSQFPTIRSYMERVIEASREKGYAETLLGRRRYLPEISSRSRQVREAAERTAINTPIQGTAADIIKIAMLRVHEGISGRFADARLLLQVHDELVLEVPETIAEEFRTWLIERMSSAYTLNVPLKVDAGMGPDWGTAH